MQFTAKIKFEETTCCTHASDAHISLASTHRKQMTYKLYAKKVKV